MISSFKDRYYFLSNFYEAPVEYEGIVYQSNEAAFQAQKTLDPIEKNQFKDYSASRAKYYGRKVKLRPDWEEVKDKIMYEICLAKFTRNGYLKRALLETKGKYLIEGNTWGDTYWGTVNGKGKK